MASSQGGGQGVGLGRVGEWGVGGGGVVCVCARAYRMRWLLREGFCVLVTADPTHACLHSCMHRLPGPCRLHETQLKLQQQEPIRDLTDTQDCTFSNNRVSREPAFNPAPSSSSNYITAVIDYHGRCICRAAARGSILGSLHAACSSPYFVQPAENKEQNIEGLVLVLVGQFALQK